MRWHGVQDLMWGVRGLFLLVAAMVVVVVMPVVFCAKVTEILKNAKNTKTSFLYNNYPFGGKLPKDREPLLWTNQPTNRPTNQSAGCRGIKIQPQ
jgi:hypothetical protein